MTAAARKLPASPDEVRARLHQLVDALLDAVQAQPPAPAVEDTVLPLSTAAARLGWRRDRLRRFCLARGVAVSGRGKLAAVDLRAVRAEMASQPRVRHDAPSRVEDDDMKAFLRGGG